MKHIFRLILLSITALLLAACSDSMYSGISDKNTSQAKQDQLEIAFINGECGKVLEILTPRVAFLTASEQYKYTNAKLCVSGMSITNVFDNIFDDKLTDVNPFEMIQSFMGTSTLDNKTITNLRETYQEVIDMCTAPTTVLDDNMKTVCGLAAAADTVLTVSEIAMKVTGVTEVKATEQGIADLISKNNVTEAQITAALNSMPPAEQQALLDSVAENINIVSDTVNVIDRVMPTTGDISIQFDSFIAELQDTSGNITTSSLANYLTTALVKK